MTLARPAKRKHEKMNKKRFDHHCSNGTFFKSKRCDFKGGIIAITPKNLQKELLMQDVAEMISYHTINIHPKLNGFSGYDTITFIIEEEE